MSCTPFSARLLAGSITVVVACLAASPAAAQSTPADAKDIAKHAREVAARAHEAAAAAAERARTTVLETATRDQLMADLDIDLDFDLPTLAFIGSELGAPREIVKNAPYTADAVNETIQVLGDGNRIVKRTTTRLARDTYGRTRQEKPNSRGTTVYLFDPISDRNFALDTQRHIAIRIPRVPELAIAPLPPGLPMPPVPPVPGVAPLPPVPPAPGMALPPPVPGVAPLPPTPRVTAIRRGSDARRTASDDVRIEVIRIGSDDMAPAPNLPGMTLPLPPEGRGEARSLGTRDIQGVKAEGTQTTHTIAAGAIGNEKPIVITRERWFSPELQLVVLVRTIDPRFGETTYRLAQLQRGEPPADLFRVPADYRVRGASRG